MIVSYNTTRILMNTSILTLINNHNSAVLVEIINDKEVDTDTCAALEQLKNYLRKFWKPNIYQPWRFTIWKEEKDYLVNSIMVLNIELVDHRKYAKLVKDVVYLMNIEVLSLLPDVCESMRRGVELKACLNFILGVAQNFTFHCSNLQEYSQHFICTMVPEVTDLVRRGQREILVLYNDLQNQPTGENLEAAINSYKAHNIFFKEILYLGLKFMKKIVGCLHKRPELKAIAFEWATFSINTLTQEDEKMSEVDIENSYGQLNHSSEEFFYFHGRKWAVKYLTKFFEQVLIYKKDDPRVKNEIDNFYHKNFQGYELIKIKNLIAFRKTEPKPD